MRLPRPSRRALLGGLVLVLLLAAGGGVWLMSKRPALRVLDALQGTGTVRPSASRLFPVPVSSEALPTHPRAWLAHVPGGIQGSVSGLLVAHGITTDGLADGRIQRLVHALAETGHVVVAPLLPAMRAPGQFDAAPQLLMEELRRFEGEHAPRVMRQGSYGAAGVCLGGASLLRAAAQLRAEGGTGPRALFLIGVPHDLIAMAHTWIVPPPLAMPKGPQDARWFARNIVLRTAVPGLFPAKDQGPERQRLLEWLRRADRPRTPPDGLSTDAGRTFANFVAGGTHDAAWARRVVEAARPRLEALSPAHFEPLLAQLEQTPVYVVHGEEDPLIPASEAKALVRSLPRAELLVSSMLDHAELSDPSWLEVFKHAAFLQAFLDSVEAP